jgi:TRAP-type C4-dicarboxylate transport system permease small subunit
MSGSTSGSVSAWRRFTEAYHKLLLILLVFSVGILVFPVSLQIFSRFTELIPHYIWTEEMARFLFIWMIMLGAIVGVRESSHFDVDLLPQLGPRATAIVRLFSSFAVLVFALVFVWSGIEFTQSGWNRTSELAELPLWMIHVAWPLTGFSWLVFLGERMWDDLRTIVTGTPPAGGAAVAAASPSTGDAS